ncbi:MAG: hypothetical protein Q9167_007295 [Letrouitia subvulpina]
MSSTDNQINVQPTKPKATSAVSMKRLSWQDNKAKKVGLTKEKLPYGHLHNDTARRTRESSADIYAPPKSDTSKESTPEATPPEPHTPSAKKRKQLRSETKTNDCISLSSPTNHKRASNELSIEPSHIRPTTFTSSDPTSARYFGSSRQAAPDDGQPFASYDSSRRKFRNSYGKPANPNIHLSLTTERKRGIKAADKSEEMVATGVNGFKKPNTEAMLSKLKTPERKKERRKFKTPIKCSPKIAPEQAHDIDSAHSSTSSSPKRQKTGFKQPPKAPPSKASPKSKNTAPRFVVPPQAPSEQSPSRNTRSRANINGTVASRPAELRSVKDIRGLVGDVQAHLNIPLDPPASSVTVSSGPSMDLDVDIDDSSLSTPLSSVPEIEEFDASDEELEFLKNCATQRAESPKAKCPMCRSVVSRLFLEGYLNSDHLNLRQQARFCKAHKIRSAEQEWRDQGYPSIDWMGFEQRLATYEHEINDVLRGDRKSFYRNSFEDQVKSGKDRTLQQALVSGSGWEGLRMGYYGSRGARVIMDYIMSTFASRVRRLANSDKLIYAAGVSGFVQAVLAPELAVLLVKDDMGVDDEQARVILRDSADIGNLLNEEEDEVIRDAEEQEEDDIKAVKKGHGPIADATTLKESVNDDDGEESKERS